MKFHKDEFTVSTASRDQMVNISEQVSKIVLKSGFSNGEILIFCPHTTAAITINENADPDVVHDMLLTFRDIFPVDRRGYRHNEGNSDAHCKSSIVGASERIILSEGRLVLGTWQGIYFCEFDGPRHRKIIVQVCGQ